MPLTPDPSSFPLPSRRHMLALAGTLPLAAMGKTRKVVLGQIGLSFYQVVGAVVQQSLEHVGIAVDVVEGLHGDIYPRLAAGEIDLLVAAWLPHAHGPLHEAARATTMELTTLYDDARLFWAVPSYVPEDKVRSIDDLLRPEVAARMDKRIVGIGPDSGLMRGAMQIQRDYGLSAAGYEVVTGPAADWVQNARAQVTAKRWCVIPLWQPQWLNRALPLRVLEEPRQIYKPDRCALVGARNLQDRIDPAAFRLLQRIELGQRAVTDMDFAMNAGGLTAQEAANLWMKRESARVAGWYA